MEEAGLPGGCGWGSAGGLARFPESGVSPSFLCRLSAQRPPADFLRSLTAPAWEGLVSALDLAPVGSLRYPEETGREGPRERTGTPRDGSSWPLLRPSTVPGAARQSRLVPLICRVWRQTSSSHLRGPASAWSPATGRAEQPRSGREASLGKPVPLKRLCPAGKSPTSGSLCAVHALLPCNPGLGDGVARAFTSKPRKLLS